MFGLNSTFNTIFLSVFDFVVVVVAAAVGFTFVSIELFEMFVLCKYVNKNLWAKRVKKKSLEDWMSIFALH